MTNNWVSDGLEDSEVMMVLSNIGATIVLLNEHVIFNPDENVWHINDCVELPQKPILYAIVTDTDEVVYIGQSSNGRKRFRAGHAVFQKAHLANVDLTDAALVWVDCEGIKSHLRVRMESKYIKQYSPILNVT